MLADLQSVENRIKRVGKKATVDATAKVELNMLEKAKESLVNNKPLIGVVLQTKN